ncbi:MAG: 23S rRNA (pseudouridine(1915)-N(3))-methyltransferase RlmH [Halothiobacillaceae bacterium]
MRIHLIAVGEKMPDWVQSGFEEYARRLPRTCRVLLHEVAPGRRGKNADIDRAVREEADRIEAVLPDNALVVALDVRGRALSTEQLAERLDDWLQGGRDIALLVGGPDGLHPDLLARAELRWSLSALTFPHPLVRVILAEQLYRAWSVLANHPYHRG